MVSRVSRYALLELEVREVEPAVCEQHVELPALPGPRLVGLPDVGVLVGNWVVAEAAAGVTRLVGVS